MRTCCLHASTCHVTQKVKRLNSQSQIFGLGCFGASLLGVLLVARVVKRSGKASIVVFLLAMVIGIGAILTAIFGGRDAILVRSLLLCMWRLVPSLHG